MARRSQSRFVRHFSLGFCSPDVPCTLLSRPSMVHFMLIVSGCSNGFSEILIFYGLLNIQIF